MYIYLNDHTNPPAQILGSGAERLECGLSSKEPFFLGRGSTPPYPPRDPPSPGPSSIGPFRKLPWAQVAPKMTPRWSQDPPR